VTGSTLAAGDLETRGFMLGTIVGKVSAGATPVAGASVTIPSTVASVVDIYYPSTDFQTNGTATAPIHGTFLMVPKTAAPIVTNWTVTAPAATGDAGALTWPVLTAGATPGTAFVLLFAASE
jgi:hypothetical protein